MEKKKLKQKCEDCNVQLIQLYIDKDFQRYIKKLNSEKKIPRERLKEILEHKPVYCPKCNFAYDNNFKKMEIKIGILKPTHKLKIKSK